jgi:hypothetical protein
MVTPFSARKVWWRCDHGHEWEAVVGSRSNGTGCPLCHPRFSLAQIRLYCEIKTVFPDCELEHSIGSNCCDLYIPLIRIAIEYDGVYWHKDKERQDLNKNFRLTLNGVTVFRVREYGLKPLSEHDVILGSRETGISVVKKVLQHVLAYLDLDGEHEQLILSYLRRNKFANNSEYRRISACLPGPPPERSLAGEYPKVAVEWHPEKNSPLTPYKVTSHSGRIFWWKCSYGHQWKAAVYTRVNGVGCPYCSGNKASDDYNLLVKFPEIAQQWDHDKNNNLRPNQFTPRSHKKIWWRCQCGHQWEAHISSRTGGYGCPYCAGLRATSENNIAVLCPDIANEFHPERNGSYKPYDFTPHSGKKVWWKCKQGHEWVSTVSNRIKGSGCPFCSGRYATAENNLAVDYPDIAKEWNAERNGDLAPTTLKAKTNKKVWWKCRKGHEWQAMIYSRTSGTGCPYCSGQRPSDEHNLAVEYPLVAREWHPTKNEVLSADMITPGSGRKVWWKCIQGHEWEATVGNRVQGTGCPYCSGNLAT